MLWGCARWSTSLEPSFLVFRPSGVARSTRPASFQPAIRVFGPATERPHPSSSQRPVTSSSFTSPSICHQSPPNPPSPARAQRGLASASSSPSNSHTIGFVFDCCLSASTAPQSNPFTPPLRERQPAAGSLAFPIPVYTFLSFE